MAILLLLLGGLVLGSGLLITGLVLRRRYKKSVASEKFTEKRKKRLYIPFIAVGSCMMAVPVYVLAVKWGDLESVKLLVEYGADIQAEDDCGYNAILVAASQLEDDTGVEMLEYLIDQGCDVEAVNNFGQNAIDILDYNAEFDYALPQDVPQQDAMRALLQTYLGDEV